MNKITFAGEAEKILKKSKTFEILTFPDGGKILSGGAEFEIDEKSFAVIPSLTEYTPLSDGEIKKVLIEKAVIPVKKVCVFSDNDGEMRFAVDSAIRHFKSRQNAKEGVLSALGGFIAAYITADYAYAELSPVTIALKEEIEQNLSNPSYAIDGSIKKLPLNYDYVRKLFKKETGATPHEYLISSRMELAASILSGGLTNKYSKYTVAQVAETCGFSEPLYFSRVFKKYFSVAPSEYAKNLNLS